MSAPQLERVTDLQALVLGALKHIGKSIERGHRHKALGQIRELQMALGGDAPPAPKARTKGIDWDAELERAQRLKISQAALARELGVRHGVVWRACQSRKVTLPVDPAAPRHRREQAETASAEAPQAPEAAPKACAVPPWSAPKAPAIAAASKPQRIFTKPLSACEDQGLARRLRNEATDYELQMIARNRPHLLEQAGIAWR